MLDSSASDLDEQRSVVLQVLQQIGVSEEKLQNMLEVWNKVLLTSTLPSTLNSNFPISYFLNSEIFSD